MKSNLSSPIAPPEAVMAPLRVLIVDDHASTLAAVAAILDHEYPMIEVIGLADNGETAIRITRADAPNVVVLDLDLGGEYGLDLMPILTANRGIVVVILSASDNPAERSRAMAAGAAAFVSKLASAEDLIAAILATRENTGG